MADSPGADRKAGKWLGPQGPGARLLAFFVAVGVVAAAASAFFAFVWAPREKALAQERWERRLGVIAEDRRMAIAFWVKELVSDIETVAAFPSFAELARREPGADVHLKRILADFVKTEELSGLVVLDGQGIPAVAIGVQESWASGLAAEFRVPVAEGKAVRLVRGPDGKPLVAVGCAVGPDHAGPLVIVGLSDPEQWLYPFLGRNLFSTKGEEILVAREGGKVLLASPSRRPDAKVLGPFAVPSGEPWFLTTREVAGTDWTLIVTFDADEAMAPFWREVREIGGVLLLGTLLAAALAVGLYRETRRRFVSQAEASAQRLAVLLDEANDAILSLDAEGKLVDANRKAEELWGRPREELLSLTIGDLETSGERPRLERSVEDSHPGGHRVYETVYVRKDGSRVPAEVSLCSATVEGRPGFLAIVRDLSARKEAERRYRLISQNAVDVIWTIDLATMRFTYVSPSVTRLRGVTPEEAMAQPIEAALTPESAAKVKATLADYLAALGRGEPIPSSQAIRVEQPRMDGSIVSTEVVATLLLDSRGKPVEVLGVTRDVTEQLAAEAEVRRSREALVETQRIAHVGSWERDARTGALTWSEEVYRIFGLDPAGPRIDQEQFLSLVHPDDREMVAGLPQGVWTGSPATDVDYRIVRPDGVERFVHSLAEIVRDADRVPIRVQGSIADVTDRKRQEDGLVRLNRELEELAATALELSQARDLPAVMARVGRAARTVKGADGAAVILRDGDRCHYADEDAIAPLWKGQRFPMRDCISGWVMENGEAASVEDVRTDPRVSAPFYETTFVRSMVVVPVGRPGAIGAIAAYWAAPRKADGEEVRFLQALADTMAVALENVHLYADLDRRVRERTVQLEQANREMEAFSYSVSHDLRAPLRAIDGFSSMLQQKYAPSLDDEGRRLVGVVRANTRKMATLIDDLLAFSRAGRSEIRLGRVAMEALAKDAIEETVPDAAARERIVLEVAPLPAARGDAALLKLVWSNLIGNAVKFSSGRERPVIRVSGELDGERAVYRVADNGVGFEMAYAGKLFGVFQRLHGVTEFEGTGVGLALVHRIVTRHGGEVSAVGAVGEGATFTFSLPAA